ncbi:helix-turn-helix domain-containing protein [Streptomyces sp. NPDC051555]|uniref:helix-turn-helix domain-containing protein n=1 Tax=Streptomyces sp. NPDC051555 TaxID=3365657 RepID=UPI0037956122
MVEPRDEDGAALEDHDEERRPAALAELRARLLDGRDKAGLSMTQWAARAGLGRTTLYEAFKGAEPPSGRVVAALAKPLRLPVDPLLDLRRRAGARVGAGVGVGVGPGEPPDAGAVPVGVGRPIAQCDPIDLEVHPSADPVGLRSPGSRGAAGSGALPGYVRREHDAVLRRAVDTAAGGTSAMVVLVGSSSTGKTRACWEAVRPLARHGWRLWHPYDPSRAGAALADIERVAPRTVVWLNEAQHYLGADGATGERVAAALRTLLGDPRRAPVLVLATLWPDYARAYAALPGAQPGPGPSGQVRQLLEGRIVVVPDAFDQEALDAAAVLAAAGDVQLARSLALVSDGHLTQQLAGAPQLLHRYRAAGPAERALLRAAMDARRLGVGPHLPGAFLTDAVADYLTEGEYDALADGWDQHAYPRLAEPVHGNLAPLRRVRPRPLRRTTGPSGAPGPAALPAQAPSGPRYRLADYLEQHGRAEGHAQCPPESFWQAAHDHLTEAEDVYRLAGAAGDRCRSRWAHHLTVRAAELGHGHALAKLAAEHEAAGDRTEAERLYRRAADRGDAFCLYELAQKREQDLGRGYRLPSAVRPAPPGSAGRAAAPGGVFPPFRPRERGTPGGLRWSGASLHSSLRYGRPGGYCANGVQDEAQEARARADVVRLYRLASDHGAARATTWLTRLAEEAGDRDEAERLALLTSEQSHPTALQWLSVLRDGAGDRDEAERLALLADRRAHHPEALMGLADRREKAGERDEAERIARLAAHHGNPRVLSLIAGRRLDAGERGDADRLYRLAADRGDGHGFYKLVALREEDGEFEEAERLALESGGLGHLAERRERAGDWDRALRLYWLDFEQGHAWSLVPVAKMCERAGYEEEAEGLYRLAADHGVTRALARLSELREAAGDRAEAERFAVLAAGDGGSGEALDRLVSNRARAGEAEEAERLAVLAADRGRTGALRELALERERAGEHQEAERLALLAADLEAANRPGDALSRIVVSREEAGAWQDAERLARLAADRGLARDAILWGWHTVNWPHGLEPDGTRSAPWE